MSNKAKVIKEMELRLGQTEKVLIGMNVTRDVYNHAHNNK